MPPRTRSPAPIRVQTAPPLVLDLWPVAAELRQAAGEEEWEGQTARVDEFPRPGQRLVASYPGLFGMTESKEAPRHVAGGWHACASGQLPTVPGVVTLRASAAAIALLQLIELGARRSQRLAGATQLTGKRPHHLDADLRKLGD
jgi:hypothetical protein